MIHNINNVPRERIYIVTHKVFELPGDSIYVPIIAGANRFINDQIYNYYLRDNVGDNISNKHNLYSELTVFYWVAKNSDFDIVGINHYRRYFIKGWWINYLRYLLSNDNVNSYLIDNNYINKIFNSGYNCIMPKKIALLPYTMYEYYCINVANGEHLIKNVRDIINSKYKSYIYDFEKELKSVFSYYKCINVMRKDIFNEMVEWLFCILSEVESMNHNLNERDLAFLGERLIGVFIAHNVRIKHIKVKELFFVNIEYRCFYKGRKSEFIYPRFIKLMFYPIRRLKLLYKLYFNKEKLWRK